MKGFSAADTHSLSGADSSNRNSVDTTDSTSEEDLIPPPLPAKTRDSTDFSSLNYSLDWNASSFSLGGALSPNGTMTRNTTTCSTTSTSIVNTSYEYVETKNFLITTCSSPIANDDKKRPPTPPPKPSRNSKHIP